MDNILKTTGCVALVIWMVVSIALATAVNGWVLSLMWAWLIVPKFGLAALGLKEAILLGMVISLMTYHLEPNRASDEKLADTIGWIITIVIRPLISLGIFWLILSNF